MTKATILNTLSAERQFDACVRWMHQQGSRISGRTLRRGLQNPHPTPRQQKAIDMAEQYLRHLSATNGPKETITQAAARAGMLPITL